MLAFKNILSPTDFSEPSYKAIKFANDLAVHFKSKLVVLHVVSSASVPSTTELSTDFDLEGYQQELEKDAWRQLKEVTERLLSKEIKDFTPMVSRGYYSDEILRVAREGRHDLIVMGTRGRTGLPHLLLGSVAERVVQLAPCPVLTIGRTVEVQLPAGLPRW
ncbi:MAG: universal stress protein [Chloroflexota bacterium]